MIGFNMERWALVFKFRPDAVYALRTVSLEIGCPAALLLAERDVSTLRTLGRLAPSLALTHAALTRYAAHQMEQGFQSVAVTPR
jgi:hypothetical protein